MAANKTFTGRRVTQVIDWDVTGLEGVNDSWEMEQSQNIDEAVKAFIQFEEEQLGRDLTFEEVKILVKFATYLQSR